MELNVDSNGFLVNRNTWNVTVMVALAKSDGFTLTPELEEYCMVARKMYDEDGVVPPIRIFSKATGGDRKGTHLNKLLHGGPMKKIAKWAGLPSPHGCI